ncbi:MAG: hypothetical protein Q9M13_09860, partial [Mariprofundales bacterium]|nr:hypothetical protein [Mariprofundales bacterium]
MDDAVYQGSASVVSIEATKETSSDVVISGANSFDCGTTLAMSSRNDVDFAASSVFTSTCAMNVVADSDCTGSGVIRVGTGSTVSSSGNNVSFVSSDVALSGSVNAGLSSMSLSVCPGTSMDVGTDTVTGAIAHPYVLSGSELSQLTCGDLSISLNGLGEIRVFTVAGVSGVSGLINLDASNNAASTVVFEESSSWPNLHALAGNTVTVNANVITSSGGDLHLESNMLGVASIPDTIIGGNVQLIAGNALEIVLGGSNAVVECTAPCTWVAANGVQVLGGEVEIAGVSGSFEVDGDSDVDGTGVVSFSDAITVTGTGINELVLVGGDLSLAAAVNAGSSSIVLQPSSSASSIMSVGNNAAVGSYHVDNAELALLFTTGDLTLGGDLTESIVVDDA